jgi:hypothetical protein
MEYAILHRHEKIRSLTPDLIAIRSMVKQFRHRKAEFAKSASPQPEQQIEGSQFEHWTGDARRQHIQPACLLQIENAVPDRDPDTRHRVFPSAEDSQRQVLDWKVGIRGIGRFNKTAAGWVVCLVKQAWSDHTVSCRCQRAKRGFAARRE